MRDTDLAITFFTFLTLLANAATLGIAGTAAAARLTGRPAPRRAWARLHDEVAGGAVGLAWLVAAVAMSGSLYFSEVAGFTPCRLCWAQRACMYPLVVLLAVAGLTRRPAWRVPRAAADRPVRAADVGDARRPNTDLTGKALQLATPPQRTLTCRSAHALSLALATVGAGIAIYHVLVERFPSLESGTCDPANPCSLVWFERFGFVTLPSMALSGFALIGTLLLTAGLRSPAPEPTHRRAEPAGPADHGQPARPGTKRRPGAPVASATAGHHTTATGTTMATTTPPTTEPRQVGAGPRPAAPGAGAGAENHAKASDPTTETSTGPTTEPGQVGVGRRQRPARGATPGGRPDPTAGSTGAAGTVGTSSAPSTSSTSTSASSDVPAGFPGRAADATVLQENRS